jgi:hypothetical protein
MACYLMPREDDGTRGGVDVFEKTKADQLVVLSEGGA